MKLSIIVPIYNAEKYLTKCVDSILAQTLTDFELILVNDGSTDDSPSICDEYAKKDPRIKVIHKENGGQADARNVGLDIAKGEYIGFVDSDDYIEPVMYEELYNLAISQNADITDSNYRYTYEDGSTNDRTPNHYNSSTYKGSDNIKNYGISRYQISDILCTKIFRRSLFDNIRFPKGKVYEDSYIMLDIVSKCNIFTATSNIYYNYFQRTGSTVHSGFSAKEFDRLDVYFKRIDFFANKNLPDAYQRVVHSFVNNYSKCFFCVFREHKEYKKNFKPYRKKAFKMISDVCKNNDICNLKKTAFILTFISPKLAYRLCIKYFPEMLGITYEEWLLLYKNKKIKDSQMP